MTIILLTNLFNNNVAYYIGFFWFFFTTLRVTQGVVQSPSLAAVGVVLGLGLG